MKTEFAVNPGKLGKHYQQHLETELWELLMETYADADYDHTWDSLEAICQLFRITSRSVAAYFDFDYPFEDDHKVSAHLEHVRSLPKDTKQMY